MYRKICKYGDSNRGFLTPGGKVFVEDAKEELYQFMMLSQKYNSLIIMTSAGITRENIDEIALKTGAMECYYKLAFRSSQIFTSPHFAGQTLKYQHKPNSQYY